MPFSLHSNVVVPVDAALEERARAHLDNLAKPRGSLGRLEELAARLYCIQEGATPLRARPARMYTIAGDHGVVAEGVAACPQQVTAQMMGNFLRGGAAINALCATAGIDLVVVDAGVAVPLPDHPRLESAKIAPGTANMAKGPAMSREQCLAALELGADLARQAHERGYSALGMGEMGIGNTTSSTAMLCAYLGFAPDEITGMGAGIPSAGLAHKTAVIETALAVNRLAPADADPLAPLAALGGFEIAALAGLVIGGAARRMAVMVDGFIATAAFVAARALNPAVEGYCFFSHGSAEAGHAKALERLGHRPLLDLGMRLGEGTGAALGLFLLAAAADAFNSMATFEKAGVVA
jgi:nicotinate-nucleotide--dimethylbenzimidazole phosphoribosyltransferase